MHIISHMVLQFFSFGEFHAWGWISLDVIFVNIDIL
jgi:hypothetical protein